MGEPVGSPAVDGLTEWFEWAEKHPQPNLDWRDRLFLEQRQGGWLASKEQVFDLSMLERFPILNAATVYAHILGLPVSRRNASSVQQSVIERVCPELASIPFNPSDRTFLARHPLLVLRRGFSRLFKKTSGRIRRLAPAHRA